MGILITHSNVTKLAKWINKEMGCSYKPPKTDYWQEVLDDLNRKCGGKNDKKRR
jgi:hypothetical protein